MNNSVDSLNKLAQEYEQIITDEATTLVTYIGFAESGVATSAAKWIIMKVTSAAAAAPMGVTTYQYAGSYKSKANIWDNRAALSYV